MTRFPWTTALRIAWRESRSSPAKFLFVIFAVAAGVGALTGVRGFSTAFDTTLNKEARTFIAADLSVRVFEVASPQQQKLLDELRQQGVDSTHITETPTMMSSATTPNPVLVSVKAVDPSAYPYYGKVRLDPDTSLKQAFNDDSVLVSDDLLVRLDVAVGDTVKIGAADFRVAAVVRSEPDRMAGTFNIGPRVMITRGGLRRADLIQVGSRASERYLFRFRAGAPPVEQVRARIAAAFQHALIADYRAAHPRIEWTLQQSTRFLSLLSLIALIVGAIGVAMAVHSHLQQKMDNIAILKCLGARSSHVMRIYTLQTLTLGLAGGVLGIAGGLGVQSLFPLLLRRYFELDTPITLDYPSAAQGLIAAVLVTLLFTLPPLISIRSIRPGILLRREMAEARPTWRGRLRQSWTSLICGLLILAGLAAVAAWLSASMIVGAYFAGGLAVSLLVLSAAAWVLLRVLKTATRAVRFTLPSPVRHGMANLYRPGNHAEWVLVAMGVGVMFTLTVYLVQHSLLREIIRSAPPNMPNVYLINITSRDRDGLLNLLRKQEGIQGGVEITPMLRGRLLSVDGRPPEWTGPETDGGGGDRERGREEGRRERRRTPGLNRSITWMESQPDSIRVLDGKWWPLDAKEPLVCVAGDLAKGFGIRPGSVLEWDVSGRKVKSRVTATFEQRRVEFGRNREFVFNPPALRDIPASYYSALRMQPSRVHLLQRDVFRAYPTVTVINAADVLEIVQGVVDQVALVTRVMSAFAILAGVIILASSVAGTRFRRMKEVAVLKTLGSRRKRLVAVFSTEFLIIGLSAGFMGSLLAVLFSRLLMVRLFNADFEFDWLANLLSVLATAAIAVAAGWLASVRILSLKPLEILRQE